MTEMSKDLRSALELYAKTEGLRHELHLWEALSDEAYNALSEQDKKIYNKAVEKWEVKQQLKNLFEGKDG